MASDILHISVCQCGYSANGLKTAVVAVKGGKLSDTSFLIEKACGDSCMTTEKNCSLDNSVPYKGMLQSYEPEGWSRGEIYYLADFTDFNINGSYVMITNGVRSYRFEISDNIWTRLTGEAVEFYRLQRCGVDTRDAVPAGFSNRPDKEAMHKACHVDDAKKGSEEGPSADMAGGWHDAGDNNKYQGNTGWVTGAIAISFLRHQKALFDYDGNGVPDLLDEVRVGAEYLLKVQEAAGEDGGLYDTVDSAGGEYYSWTHPADETAGVRGDKDDRVAHTRSDQGAPHACTYDAAMKSAGGLAAAARAFSRFDPGFSARCKYGGIKAYDWAIKHTGHRGGYYCSKDPGAPRLWAAVQLYRLTGKAIYGDWIAGHVESLTFLLPRSTNYWGLEPVSLAEYYPVAGPHQEKVISLLSGNVNPWRESLVKPFGVSSVLGLQDFGINEKNLSAASDAYRYFEITGDTAFRDAALSAMQWTLGVNPWNISWISGVGTSYVLHLHSRMDEDARTNPDSTIKMPGTLAAGALWSDMSGRDDVHPWYEDRPLACDIEHQWRYNEFSISINYPLLDLITAFSCE